MRPWARAVIRPRNPLAVVLRMELRSGPVRISDSGLTRQHGRERDVVPDLAEYRHLRGRAGPHAGNTTSNPGAPLDRIRRRAGRGAVPRVAAHDPAADQRSDRNVVGRCAHGRRWDRVRSPSVPTPAPDVRARGGRGCGGGARSAGRARCRRGRDRVRDLLLGGHVDAARLTDARGRARRARAARRSRSLRTASRCRP